MTEEEFFIKNYPDSCYGNKPLSPHWDFFQDGVEFGERKSEKQIEIDAKHIIALQKQNGELTDKCRMLEDKLANADYQLEGRDLEIKELEAQIKKMKCCYNCSKWNEGLLLCNDSTVKVTTYADYCCEDWEIKEK